jgi:hypothetical protein
MSLKGHFMTIAFYREEVMRKDWMFKGGKEEMS